MTREIFYVDDINVAKACIAFAETLGLTVASDIHKLEEGMYLTTGSTKFNVNWIRNEAFATGKQSLIFDLLEDNSAGDFISHLLEGYTPDTDNDEVSLEETLPTPDIDTICALYNKVRSQKKSPTRYHVTLKGDSWVATTSDADSYGNLAVLFVAAGN
jgi:hypothetical protein